MLEEVGSSSEAAGASEEGKEPASSTMNDGSPRRSQRDLFAPLERNLHAWKHLDVALMLVRPHKALLAEDGRLQLSSS